MEQNKLSKMYTVVCKEYKTRHSLSLAERVEVIQEHDQNQTSQESLAKKFNCSRKQIRTILLNRKRILNSLKPEESTSPKSDAGTVKAHAKLRDLHLEQEQNSLKPKESTSPKSDAGTVNTYANLRDPYLEEEQNSLKPKKSTSPKLNTLILKTYSKIRDLDLEKEQDKINFLGMVMYEYIQRVLYHNYNIDDETVREKALEIKKRLGLEIFHPTCTWLRNFKMMYGIPAFDLETLRNNVIIIESKRPDLTATDLIQYVRRAELEAYVHDRNTACNEPKIICEEDDELRKLHLADDEVNHDNTTPKKFKYATKRKVSSPVPFIESLDEALRHVRYLEDYALLQENYSLWSINTGRKIFKKQKRSQILEGVRCNKPKQHTFHLQGFFQKKKKKKTQKLIIFYLS